MFCVPEVFGYRGFWEKFFKLGSRVLLLEMCWRLSPYRFFYAYLKEKDNRMLGGKDAGCRV